MKSTEIPVNLTLPPSKVPRSQGIHVSAIIRALATESGILKPEWAEEVSLVDVREITDPIAILRISIGLAWEEWYLPTHLGPLGVVDHPGELEVDGVFMTPDGESLSTFLRQVGCNHYTSKAHTLVHEVKATYKSTRTVGDMTDEPLYLMQVKSYCRAVGTRFAVMHVLFLCGDYKFPIQPQIKSWLLEFSEDEISLNWELLMDYKEERLRIEGLNG